MLPYCSEVTAVKFSWVDVVMLGFEGVQLLVLLQKTYVTGRGGPLRSGSGLLLEYLRHTGHADSGIAVVWIPCHFEGVIKIQLFPGSGRGRGLGFGVEKTFLSQKASPNLTGKAVTTWP